MKYLPFDQGDSSAFDVSTSAPVRVTYDRECGHLGLPVGYQMMDRRAEAMPKWYGACCAACGFILTKTRLL